MARVRAVLRVEARSQVLEVERLLFDEEHGVAARAGRELALTSTELRLLAFSCVTADSPIEGPATDRGVGL